MCKVEENGGMSCCYTPDMIPGTPHAYFVTDNPNTYYVVDKEIEAAVNDERKTSIYLGGRYVPGAYSTSGNFFLVRVMETFAHMSGPDVNHKTAVNGIFAEGMFFSAAPKFDYFLIKNLTGELTVRVEKGKVLTLAIDGSPEHVQVEGAEILEQKGKEIVLKTLEKEILIRGI